MAKRRGRASTAKKSKARRRKGARMSARAPLSFRSRLARASTRLRRPLRFIARAALMAAGSAFIGSLLWIGAYRFFAPPTTHQMQVSADGEIAYRFVPLEAIAPALGEAVIGAEDARFCAHGGIDWAAVEEALQEAQTGEAPRGASTISQQTAKNAFLWHGRSWVRKGLEAYFTLTMEFLWPKRRILEVYLNVAEFGPGVFGAEAAAQTYFAKSAADLTRREAALLAAVLPNPRRFRLARPSHYVRTRAAILERRAAIVRRDGLAACVYGS